MERISPARMSFAALLLACTAIFLPIDAQGDPSLQQILAQQGLSRSDVAMAWRERPPSAASTIYGVHLTTANPDFYYDNTGRILSAAELSQLGVAQKDWTWKSVSVPSEFPSTAKKTAATPIPQPKIANFSVPELQLGAPDVDQALFEDELEASSPAKGVLRIGIFQEVGVPIEVGWGTATEGVWRALPDGGRVWSLRLSAAGAAGIRVHFPGFAAPAGAELLVYNPDFADEAYGPFKESGEFWSPTCFGESAGIELYLPAGASGAADEVLLDIDRIAYQYRGLDTLPKAAAGACNHDLACEGEQWRDIGAAAGGIGYIASVGELWCTGTLLADEVSGAAAPLFLTADHCINSQSKAAWAEVYWLYAAETCNNPASVPSPSSVPRSSRADYLAGAPRVSGTDLAAAVTGTDVTLLRLRGEVPAAIPHAGYTTDGVPAGTDAACIHHPQGNYKCIAFGETGSYAPDPIAPAEKYIDVGWTLGTTEGGSSGAALFVGNTLDTVRIAGQLYGGYASCAHQDAPDFFGKFSASYPILEPWLTHAQYKLAIDVEGGGSVAMQGRSGTIAPDTPIPFLEGTPPIVLTATPDEGKQFSSWRIGSGTNLDTHNPITLPTTGDLSVVAVFVSMVKMTIQTSGDGTVTMNGAETAGVVTVPAGSEVQLTATPASSRAFVDWEMSNTSERSTDNPLVFTASEDVAVTAHFKKMPMPICGVSGGDSGFGSAAADALLVVLLSVTLACGTRRFVTR